MRGVHVGGTEFEIFDGRGSPKQIRLWRAPSIPGCRQPSCIDQQQKEKKRRLKGIPLANGASQEELRVEEGLITSGQIKGGQ